MNTLEQLKFVRQEFSENSRTGSDFKNWVNNLDDEAVEFFLDRLPEDKLDNRAILKAVLTNLTNIKRVSKDQILKILDSLIKEKS